MNRIEKTITPHRAVVLYKIITKRNIEEEDYWWAKDWLLDRDEVLKYNVNWSFLTVYRILPEEFIRTFEDKLNWTEVSIHQRLSESFIEEFQDKVDWFYITQFQKLSPKFLQKHQLRY